MLEKDTEFQQEHKNLEVKKMGEGVQKVRPSSYKCYGIVIYSIMSIVNSIVFLKGARRTDLKSSHHKEIKLLDDGC